MDESGVALHCFLVICDPALAGAKASHSHNDPMRPRASAARRQDGPAGPEELDAAAREGLRAGLAVGRRRGRAAGETAAVQRAVALADEISAMAGALEREESSAREGA